MRKELDAKRLERAIADFHKNIHGEEVAQQLKGIKPCRDVLGPQTMEYELEERAEVAKLFSQAADIINREELFRLRMRLVLGLSQLCKRRESPRRMKTAHNAAKSRSKATHPQKQQHRLRLRKVIAQILTRSTFQVENSRGSRLTSSVTNMPLLQMARY